MPALPSNRRPGRLADYSADHRMLILAAMAIVAGTGGAFSAWALLRLIAFTTNAAWYGNLSFAPAVIADRAPLLVLLIPVVGGPDRRPDGAVRVGQDPRPRHSRSDRDHPLRREQAVAQSGAPETLVVCGVDWQRRPIRRRRPDHHDRRRDRLAVRPIVQLERRRAQDLAGRRRDRGNDRHLRDAVRLDHARGRVAAVRMEAAQLRAGRDGGAGRPRMASAAGRRRAAVSVRRADARRDRARRNLRGASGLVTGLLAAVLSFVLYRIEDGFHRLPIHWMWWPAIGAIVVGIGGLIDLRVLGAGYGASRRSSTAISSSRRFSCCSSSRRSCGWSRSAPGPRAGSSRRC